jgi:hypothetical protein
MVSRKKRVFTSSPLKNLSETDESIHMLQMNFKCNFLVEESSTKRNLRYNRNFKLKVWGATLVGRL